jgi:predicted transcriptional regulator
MESLKERNGRPPGMDSLPSDLIRSLRVLGLSNYEAKVYGALVLFDHAEAKEITDFLSLSKPSVYEALESLAERGLAVRQSSKPARFSAVPPDMAIKILLEDHERASEQALAALKRLEQEKVRSDMENIVWTIYGDANIKYKIHEMFGKARDHISCTMGGHYVRFLENVRITGVPLRLTILSSSPGLEEKMRKKFPGKDSEILVIPLERFTSPPPAFPFPEIAEVWGFLEFGNVLELNVDDEELLWSPAFIRGVGSVLNTHNKGAIIYLKLFSGLFWKRIYGDDTVGLSPAKETKKTGRPRRKMTV